MLVEDKESIPTSEKVVPFRDYEELYTLVNENVPAPKQSFSKKNKPRNTITSDEK